MPKRGRRLGDSPFSLGVASKRAADATFVGSEFVNMASTYDVRDLRICTPRARFVYHQGRLPMPKCSIVRRLIPLLRWFAKPILRFGTTWPRCQAVLQTDDPLEVLRATGRPPQV